MIMSEWKEYRLGDICETNKSQYSNKENWHNFKYLDTGNITKGNIDNIQKFDSFESLPSRARRKVTDGDIIYSSVRPNQEHYGYISNPSADILVSTGFIVISANKDIINPIFLYNYLTQPKITKYLQAIGEQSVCTYPAIKPSDIEDLVIKIPSLDIQAIIASILSSLDSKIENNRKICANLEAQAQALFKHWFIDFAPFKDGKFVESELGMIPEGWRVNTIDDFCRVFTGKKNTNQAENNGKYPFFSCAPNPLKSNDYLYDGYAIIIAGNGSYTGRTQLYNGKFDLYQRTYACVAKERSFDKKIVFFYLVMKQTFEREKMGGTRGSSIPFIVMNDIAKQYFCYNEYVVTEFCNIVRPILDMTQALRIESSRLSSLRDTLLPKLMSGEIKV